MRCVLCVPCVPCVLCAVCCVLCASNIFLSIATINGVRHVVIVSLDEGGVDVIALVVLGCVGLPWAAMGCHGLAWVVIQKSVILIYPFRIMGYKQFAMNAHHGSMVR